MAYDIVTNFIEARKVALNLLETFYEEDDMFNDHEKGLVKDIKREIIANLHQAEEFLRMHIIDLWPYVAVSAR